MFSFGEYSTQSRSCISNTSLLERIVTGLPMLPKPQLSNLPTLLGMEGLLHPRNVSHCHLEYFEHLGYQYPDKYHYLSRARMGPETDIVEPVLAGFLAGWVLCPENLFGHVQRI